MGQTTAKVELLAPAGSPVMAKAVIGAGADALYFGGEAFGARAYAPNFSRQEAAGMLDLAHLYGRKAYLTVNTVIKNREMERQMYDYLRFYFENGVDGVLVQDFGVLTMLRDCFGSLPVHASTQMNIMTRYGADFLAKNGVKRIVARNPRALRGFADRGGGLRPRGAVRLLFRAVLDVELFGRAKRQPGAVRPAVSSAIHLAGVGWKESQNAGKVFAESQGSMRYF